MALNKAQLKADLLAAMAEASNVDGTTPAERRELLADRFANAIDAYVKTGDGKYLGGMVAGSTAVTAPANPTVIKLN